MDQAKPAVNTELQQRLAWIQFYAKKGWNSEWRETVMFEFIEDQKLFGELIKFAEKRSKR